MEIKGSQDLGQTIFSLVAIEIKGYLEIKNFQDLVLAMLLDSYHRWL